LPERGEAREKAAELVNVSPRSVESASKVLKGARDKRIFDLWLACWTNEEIGEAVGLTPQGVGQVLKETAELPEVSKPAALHQAVGCERSTVDHALRETANLPESAKPAAQHLTDFDPPLYNVWKQQEKTNKSQSLTPARPRAAKPEQCQGQDTGQEDRRGLSTRPAFANLPRF
jgi:hypothetical protein